MEKTNNVDVTSEDGKGSFRRLVRKANVLVKKNRPGAMRKLLDMPKEALYAHSTFFCDAIISGYRTD